MIIARSFPFCNRTLYISIRTERTVRVVKIFSDIISRFVINPGRRIITLFTRIFAHIIICISKNIPACNRTLYGDVGRTYRVEIRRPREDRLPFLCHLNFTAAGSDLGDLVQVGHRNDVVVENNADRGGGGPATRVGGPLRGQTARPRRRAASEPG